MTEYTSGMIDGVALGWIIGSTFMVIWMFFALKWNRGVYIERK